MTHQVDPYGLINTTPYSQLVSVLQLHSAAKPLLFGLYAQLKFQLQTLVSDFKTHLQNDPFALNSPSCHCHFGLAERERNRWGKPWQVTSMEFSWRV
nr:hypothetical protein CFP56_78646 [Quercus suber]